MLEPGAQAHEQRAADQRAGHHEQQAVVGVSATAGLGDEDEDGGQHPETDEQRVRRHARDRRQHGVTLPRKAAGWRHDGAVSVGPARRHGPVHRGGGDPPPTRAGRAPRGGRRARRPDGARGGLDGVLRGAGVRRPVRDAAQAGRTPLPRRGVPAGGRTRLRGGVGRRDGHPASRARRRRRGARVGRGVRRDRDRRPAGGGPDDPGERPRGDRAALLGGHRGHQGARQDRHRLRQAARHLRADPRPTGSR